MNKHYLLLLPLLIIIPNAKSLHQPCRRRSFVQHLCFLPVISPQPSFARQGAAEYDFEYYLRDLWMGNPVQGTESASTPPPLPPPRVLTGPLLPLLLNDDCSSDCVPVRVLKTFFNNQNEFVRFQTKFQAYRSNASRSFAARAPWKEPTVNDQYYFDLTAYALWRAVADVLPDYTVRQHFVQQLGHELYNSMPLTQRASVHLQAPITSTLVTLLEILNQFVASNYMTSYQLGDNESTTILDDLDDETLMQGGTVNLLISLYQPATLQAALQITGEQSRFVPEYVGTTLVALFDSVGLEATYETYFVDSTYRPNPKDYFPNQVLLQFTLSLQQK
jgi:hypothetical protein